MIEKEKYSAMMDEIHVPSEVLGKVMNMKSETKTLNRTRMMHNIATIAAVLAVCFVASNGICYAASGKTWVETVKIYINGEETEQEIYYEEDGDKVSGTMTFDVDENESMNVSITTDLDADGNISDTITADTGGSDSMDEVSLESKGGKLYLIISNTTEIDITDDFSDGLCEGSFTLNETTYWYKITGNELEYSIDLFY